jgi:hypothetical protein
MWHQGVKEKVMALAISWEHMNSVGQRHHHLMPNQKLAGGVAMRSGPQVTMGAYSESNLLVLSSQQHKYSPQHNTQHKSAFLYGNMANSERTDLANSGTSSSNESVSSLHVRDVNNHNDYAAVSPQKSKRGNVLGLHYATGYRPPESLRVRTLYACLGENDGELSFEPNQIITNVRPSLEPGWLEGTLNGKTGLVPENYVEFLP